MCSQQARTTHEALLEDLVNQCGARVALVGQSGGGVFARWGWRRARPDLIEGIVTLDSPPGRRRRGRCPRRSRCRHRRAPEPARR
jgi:pimeloyl-ACP methyl ester carboxylesterase